MKSSNKIKTTTAYKGKANWSRSAYLKLIDDKVIFDCSDGEYGPIEFDINLLVDAFKDHLYRNTDVSDWDATLLDGLEDEDFSSWDIDSIEEEDI